MAIHHLSEEAIPNLGKHDFHDARLKQAIRENGFAVVPASGMHVRLGERAMAAWPSFQDSWHDLGVDRYMADGGRYRRRRFAAFSVTPSTVERKPHQPHYQSRDHNALNGGIQRWFEPVTAEVANHLITRAIFDICRSIFGELDPAFTRTNWHGEFHQFRIEAADGLKGMPTPEGLHRDGVDWVFIALIARENVASGITTIEGPERIAKGEFTLSTPLEAVFLNDRRVMHGVTPIEPIEKGRPAYRDVLVLTLVRDENKTA